MSVPENNMKIENGAKRKYRPGARNMSGLLRAGCLAACCAIVFVALLSGCATTNSGGRELPPLLAQDELLRPYVKMAVVEVNREQFGDVYELKTEDYDWAYQALREEAATIGADAVILPEIKVEATSYIFFPSSNVNGRGTAIKFR